MFNKILVSTALLAALVAPLAASAGEVQNRIDAQRQRIDQGVRDGSLTYGEARRLNRAENRIQMERDHALRDGRLTAGERMRLNRQENRLSGRIYNDRHNAWHQR
jgi:hypothetical protein